MTENRQMTLSPNLDPMGSAIKDFHRNRKASKLRVLSSLFDEDEIPVPYLFRSFPAMPQLEQTALKLVKGKVLDVGAGAGCHSLYLQDKGFEVTAIDISSLSCEVMRERGLKDVRCVNLYDEHFFGLFDTILLLMNGTGIAGKLCNLPTLLSRLSRLLENEGQVLIDSCDLCYIFEDKDGKMDYDGGNDYYGEVDYQMKYKRITGEKFDWLYVDFNTLKGVAEGCGWKCELVEKGENYDYLAKLMK